MAHSKLARPSKERIALLRNQASYLLWNGFIETTETKAKEVKAYAEKIISLAVRSYQDVVKVTKTKVGDNGEQVKMEVINDGPKKLAARRKIMTMCYDMQEQRKDKESKDAFKERTKDIKHPLVEKIFNVYAPRYAERAEKLGQGGGYTTIVKLGKRRGDNADMARVELITE